MQIKNLEKRLECLQKKYQELTTDLERERRSITSDDSGNVPEILMERMLVHKQINMTKAKIESLSKSRKVDQKQIAPGTFVKLKNHDHNLEVFLVEEQSSHPGEGYISTKSPIGKAILGKIVGEEVVVELPRGKAEYTISSTK